MYHSFLERNESSLVSLVIDNAPCVSKQNFESMSNNCDLKRLLGDDAIQRFMKGLD